MKTDYILFNLKEANEELHKLIVMSELWSLDELDFEVKIAHCYHHLNHARNGRSGWFLQMNENFEQWKRFPIDNEFIC